jgi:RimJ/RimL family protein N-acetyltransferase
MLDAYRGTIDYEDEALEDAIDEVGQYFEDDPLLDNSYIALKDGKAISAVLVQVLDGGPFIRSVMTDPTMKNTGCATAVTAEAMRSLASMGHHRLTLFITEGNTPSEKLFSRLGARVIPNE